MPNALVLHKTQEVVANDLHRFRVLLCGRRWGKTTLAIDTIKARAGILSNSRIAYIAPTYQQARDIAWEELKRDCRDVAGNINEARLEIKLINGSIIILRGWEAIETLRGQSFDLVVLDEVAMMRGFWLNWQEVIRPTLTDTKGEGLFISTPKGFNHFYDLYNEERKDSDYKSFHFTTYDNPYLPVEEIEKAKKELTEDRFSQEYLADFRKTEGLVYKEFNRALHIFGDEKIKVAKTFGGVDFGFTNPCAIIEVQKDWDNNYFVFEKMYKVQQTDAQIADFVASLKWNECYPDPESASGIEELRRRHVNVREVIKGKDSIRNGINTIRELLKSNRLLIHKDSSNLIWELENYSYPDKKDMHNEAENPIKEHDHGMDALRYALMMQIPERPIIANFFRKPETNPAF